jgi:hypothetical protein
MKSINILDIETIDVFDNDIKTLTSEYQGWTKTDKRGYQQLWSMLGRVYELGAKAEGNMEAHQSLVALVEKEPSVKKNVKWKAERKKPRELLVTLLLGLKEETKATKSQWLGALRAADKAKVEANQSSFSAWMKDIGGIQAARKTLGKDKAPSDLSSLIPELDSFVDPDHDTWLIPPPFGGNGEVLPEGVGLVIVRDTGNGLKALPVATLTNEKLLISAIKKLLAEGKKQQRGFQRDARAEMRERDREAKKVWKSLVKESAYEESFEQFLEDGGEKVIDPMHRINRSRTRPDNSDLEISDILG